MSGGGDGIGTIDSGLGDLPLVADGGEFSADGADMPIGGGDGIGSAASDSDGFSAGSAETSGGSGGIGPTDPGSGDLPLPYATK